MRSVTKMGHGESTAHRPSPRATAAAEREILRSRPGRRGGV
jgi:hypothetical protein